MGHDRSFVDMSATLALCHRLLYTSWAPVCIVRNSVMSK